MVRLASLWTLRAVDGVVGMVTELDGVGRLGLDALRKAMEEQAATRASWVATAMKRGASWMMNGWDGSRKTTLKAKKRPPWFACSGALS